MISYQILLLHVVVQSPPVQAWSISDLIAPKVSIEPKIGCEKFSIFDGENNAASNLALTKEEKVWITRVLTGDNSVIDTNTDLHQLYRQLQLLTFFTYELRNLAFLLPDHVELASGSAEEIASPLEAALLQIRSLISDFSVDDRKNLLASDILLLKPFESIEAMRFSDSSNHVRSLIELDRQIDQLAGFDVLTAEDEVVLSDSSLPYAENWSAPHTRMMSYFDLELLFQELNLAPRQMLVSLGSGYGREGIALKRVCPGCRYRGFEANPSRSTSYNNVAASFGWQRTHKSVHGDFLKVPLPKFDVGFAFEPVDSDQSLAQLIDRMNEFAKPGGKIVFAGFPPIVGTAQQLLPGARVIRSVVHPKLRILVAEATPSHEL